MNEFFEITNRSDDGGQHEFRVLINGSHRVFEGHFPGNPIVPGVMTMMMVRRCAEEILGRETHFASVSQCKYSKMIVPDGKEIAIKFSLNDLTLSAEVASLDGEQLMKIKGTLA